MMDTAERSSVEPVDQVYDGFISYSHAADDLLAPRLQAGLQRFAKPWWKRRAVRIFRDESSLSANPHLWSSITEALDTSGWFVLLLSPDAAESVWVNQEIAYWVEHRDPKKILPVVTDGEFGWTDGDVMGDAIPDTLRGVFAEEPRWVDLRFAREEQQLDLKHPEFNSVIADIASTIRGVPKDELASEEVRQHRRTVRTVWAAGVSLLVLAVAATGAAVFAFAQQAEANRQRDLAVANEQRALASEAEAQRESAVREAERLLALASSVGETDPETAMLLLLQAITIAPPNTSQSELRLVLRDAMLDYPVLQTYRVTPGRNTIALSGDGETIFYGSPRDWNVVAVDVETGEARWVKTIDVPKPAEDELLRPPLLQIAADPAGEQLVVVVSGRAQSSAQLLVLEPQDGSTITTLTPGACGEAWLQGDGFSSDGSLFSVTSGTELCGADDSPDDDWAVWYETETWVEAGTYAVADGLAERVRFLSDPDRVVISYAFGRRLSDELIDLVDSSSGSVVMAMDGAWPTVDASGEVLVYHESGRAPEGFYGRGGEDIRLVSLMALDGPIDLGLDAASTPLEHNFAIGNITQYAFSPTGSRLAAVFERSALVFNSLGERLYEFRYTTDAYDLAWFSDGSRLFTSHEDRLILWSVGPDRDRTAMIHGADDWPALALELLSRSFTEAECLQFGISPCPSLDDLRVSLG